MILLRLAFVVCLIPYHPSLRERRALPVMVRNLPTRAGEGDPFAIEQTVLEKWLLLSRNLTGPRVCCGTMIGRNLLDVAEFQRRGGR